jgi:CRP-like cAMP-binding protein
MLKITQRDLEFFTSIVPVSDKTDEAIKVKAGRKVISRGETLFSEKDPVKTVYFILKGKVTMFRLGEEGQKRVIYILNAGEFINEVIFDGLPSSISCEAFEDCELLYFYKEDLLKMMSEDFELNKHIINSMGRKIRRLYRQVKNTVPIKIDKKLAAKLWKLSKDYGLETEGGTLIDLDISITYLASMLGSSRETISKCMTRFEKDGLVKFIGRKILIPDRQALSIYFRGISE